MRRRQFLAGGAAATTTALAGCVGGLGGLTGPEFGAASDPWSNESTTEGDGDYGQSGTVTLPPNTYAQASYNPQIAFTLSVSAAANNPMDIFVLDQNEFNRYRDKDQFQFYEGFSARDTSSPQFSGRLNPGDYYVVFDNADFTGTQSAGELTADYRIHATV